MTSGSRRPVRTAGVRAAACALLLALATATQAAPDATSPSAPLRLEPEETLWVQAHAVLRIGYSASAPLAYRNGSGDTVGLAVELVNEACRRAGLRPQWVYYDSWRAAQAAFAAQTVDALGVVSTGELAGAQLTQAYMPLQNAIFLRKDAPFTSSIDMLGPGAIIATVADSAALHVLRQRYPGQKLLVLSSVAQAMQALQERRADAAVGNLAVFDYDIERRGGYDLRVAGLFDSDAEARIAVQADQPLALSALDKAIASISNAQRDAVLNQWFQLESQDSADAARTQRWVLPGAISLLGGLLLLSYWTVRLRREVRGRSLAEAELRATQARLADALRETSTQFDAIMRNAPAAIWAKDVDGVFLFGNKAYYDMFGVPSHIDMVGRTDDDFFSPDIARVYRDNDRRVRESGVAERLIEHNVRDGRQQQVLSTKFPIFDAQGKAFACGGICVDVTEQVRLQEALRSINQRLAVREEQLLRLSSEPAIDNGDLVETYRLITAAVCTSLAIQRASVWYLDESRQSIVSQWLHDTQRGTSDAPTVLTRADFAPYFASLESERILAAHSASTDPRTACFTEVYLKPLDIRSMLDVSIRHHGRSIGVICCERVGAERAWTEDESSFVGALADLIGRALTAAERRAADERLRDLNASLEQRVAERTAAAEDAQRRLQVITDTIDGAVIEYVRQDDGRELATFVSSGMQPMTGLARDAVMRDPTCFFDAVRRSDQPGYRAALQRSAELSVDLRYAFRLRHAVSGEWRWLLTVARPPQREQGRLVWRGYIIDITEQKHLEQQLGEARDQANEASKAKSEFLANMSHEIRTPMNAVIGLSHLALKTELDRRQHDYLSKIHNSAQSLLGIINDILDLSKIEAGKLGVERVDFDLLDVLDNLSSLVSVRAQEKGLELLVSAAPGLPYALTGDPLRLGQVLLNLTGNAIKFTDSGQVLVSVSEVPESRRNGETLLRFAISDTGIGLSQEQCARLFRAFSQADASTTRRYGGTGLGLAISKQLAELMGGQIGVDSVPGQGSTFWFTARLALAEPRIGRLPSAEPLLGRRALVVDDNHAARDIVENYAGSFGMQVQQAASGEQAVAMAQAAVQAGQPYELVLMDWQMPGMDGIEAARELRKLDASPRIILLTAYGREEVMHRAVAESLDGVLIKPVNPSLLLDASLQALFGDGLPGDETQRAGGDENAHAAAGLTVLLAEDNEINQQVAVEVMRGFGARVDVADNGRIALDKLMGGRRYNLVLMDMQMPELDGLGATRAIRANPAIAHVPIIAMTANAMEADRQACYDAGMDDFISKPFKPAELLRLLRKWGRGESLLAAPDPQADGQHELRAFNRDDGIERVGSAAMLGRLCRQFFAQQPGRLQGVGALVESGEREAAIRAAHSAAGAAGLLGFEQLAAAARELQARLHGGQVFDAALCEVQRAMASALEAFSLSEEAAAAAPVVAVAALAPELRDDLLAQLQNQVESYDSQATDTMSRLLAALGAAAPPLAAKIDEMLMNFDFDQAARQLPELRAALHGMAGALPPEDSRRPM